jgi:release factor glutamine methyltransferase
MTPTVAVDPGPTVAAALRDTGIRLAAAGIPTARQDAELLLALVLRTTRLALYTGDPPVALGAARTQLDALVARRLKHEPVQYLLGETEFCGLRLELGPGVFIPRPETEALVERALELGPSGPGTVLELCAGSGAIACALAAQRASWTVWAVEDSAVAADCARANARRLGLDRRVRIREGDLFAPLRGSVAARAVDLVVANPPYLATAILPTLPAEVRDWEPRAALDGGSDGLEVIRRLLGEAPDWLRPGGGLLVEIGEEHGPEARALVEEDGRYVTPLVHRDFRGCERVLETRRR